MEASWAGLEASWAVLEVSWGILGAFERVAMGVRRIRVGQSKGQIRPFLSLSLDHATGSPARRQGPADCQRLRRSPPAPYFLGWLFWKANLWRQAFFENKFEEAGWTANSSKKSSKNLPKWSQNGAKTAKKSIKKRRSDKEPPSLS